MLKYKMEVGEYVGDYGFPLLKPVSIQSRMSTIKVLDRGRMQTCLAAGRNF